MRIGFRSILLVSLGASLFLAGCTKSGGGSDERSGSGSSSDGGVLTNCGVVVDGQLANPVNLGSGDLVSVIDILGSNLVVVTDGEQKLVKLHGVSAEETSIGRERRAEVFFGLGSQAYLIQPDSDCTANLNANSNAVVGQLISPLGRDFSEELLLAGAARAETADVCGGELIGSCYAALEERGQDSLEQEQQEQEDEIDLDDLDDFFGGGGDSYLLYKPTSDSDGNFVILHPDCNVSIRIKGSRGEAALKDTGSSNNRCTTLRGDRPGCALGDNVQMFVTQGGKTDTFTVGNGCRRAEFRNVN